MSQADRNPTAPDAERHPSLTFMDPWSDRSRHPAPESVDILDRTADVVAFVNAAVTAPREIDFDDKEKCGLASILRAVENSLRQAGELARLLETERDQAKERGRASYLEGLRTFRGTDPEDAAEYPRFDAPEGEEGEGVISDAPEPAPKKRGAARS